MPKMVGPTWAPRMGSPEGILPTFPFPPQIPPRVQQESQEPWPPSLSPHRPRVTLVCSFTLLCRPQSPQLWNGLGQPDTLQVYELGQGVLLAVFCGNMWEALVPLLSGLAESSGESGVLQGSVPGALG